MSPDLQTYLILVLVGFLLLAAEIFIPGGILGVIGGLALLAALGIGFSVFEGFGGVLSAILLVVGSLIYVALWMKYAPRSRLGKMFTLENDGKDFKSHDDRAALLLGHEGFAHTDLRPSGMAMIDGKRIDVVSDAGFVNQGTAVKVVRVEGARVVVRPTGETH